MDLVVGNKNLSSWSLRPWLAMKHANVPFVEHVVLFEEPGWRDRIVEVSPSRRVPALKDGNVVIWDSLAICEYVAELAPALWPSDRTARAVARSVSAEMHSGFGNLRKDMSMDVMARHPRKVRSHETQADIDRIVQIWSDPRFAKDGPFLFGAFSIADAMFAPVVYRFRTYDVPLEGRAAEYAKTMLELPAMKEWEHAASLETPPAKLDPTSAQHSFAVIFSSQHTGADPTGYGEIADHMEELARKQPGFLAFESARGTDGFGITVSYWDSLEAIARWKVQTDHRRAQERGRASYYERYEVRVCSVERGYKFPR